MGRRECALGVRDAARRAGGRASRAGPALSRPTRECPTLRVRREDHARTTTQRAPDVFEPESPHEAVQGWALHTTRRRKIHEAEARHLDRLRYWVGALSAALAAVAGTSAFAAWESESTNTAAAVATAIVGIGAAVLASVLTFLDLGGRAEAHRRSAAAYKRVLREFEQASGMRRGDDGAIDDEALQRLKALLDETDAAAPVVPVKRGERVEQQPFRFVGTADALAPNPSRPTETQGDRGADDPGAAA